MTDAFPADTAIGQPVHTLSKPEIMVELQSYKPKTTAEVQCYEPWMKRRQALWRRLDWFTRLRAGS